MSEDNPTPPRTVAGFSDGAEIQIPVPTEAVLAPVSDLQFHPRNPRQGDVGAAVESIVENGFFTALTVSSDGYVLAGNHRLKAALQLGMKEIPVLRVDVEGESPDGLRILLADNRVSDLATYDTEELVSLLTDLQGVYPALEGTGYDGDALDDLLHSLDDAAGNGDGNGDNGDAEEGNGDAEGDAQATPDPERTGGLARRFLIPPFSTLDTRQGYWRERKRQWLSLGLKSEIGRDAQTFDITSQGSPIFDLKNALRDQMQREPSWDEVAAEAQRRGMHLYSGMSVFDPVLTELSYLWFCPPSGTVLDPFAGGSVRGAVAAALGLQYVGVELRGEQVEANREQWVELEPRLKGDAAALPTPAWIQGDSLELPNLAGDVKADLIFTCPPYADLEKYSDDPRDISNMDYDGFLRVYRQIIAHAVAQLRDNRFVVFVVNDVRDKKGLYRGLLSDTIRAIEDAGAAFYNEIVLINAIGSAAVRAGKQFSVGRKVARTHQNVLVFFKGDPKTIRDNFPDLDIPDLEALSDPENATDTPDTLAAFDETP